MYGSAIGGKKKKDSIRRILSREESERKREREREDAGWRVASGEWRVRWNERQGKKEKKKKRK